MASSKSIIRSFIILIIVLASGFLGLWFLSGDKITIKNQGTSQTNIAASETMTDTFGDLGGETPQETLSMLITALENNDLTLAAKYFIPLNRETVSEDLSRLDNTKLLGDLIKDLKGIKSGKLNNENHYSFEISDETGQTATELELIKNQSGFWKVISL